MKLIYLLIPISFSNSPPESIIVLLLLFLSILYFIINIYKKEIPTYATNNPTKGRKRRKRDRRYPDDCSCSQSDSKRQLQKKIAHYYQLQGISFPFSFFILWFFLYFWTSLIIYFSDLYGGINKPATVYHIHHLVSLAILHYFYYFW